MSDYFDSISYRLDEVQTTIDSAREVWNRLKDFEFVSCSPAVYFDHQPNTTTIYIHGIEKFKDGLIEAREACKLAFPDWTDTVTEINGYSAIGSAVWSCENHPEIAIRFSCPIEAFPESLMKKGCNWIEEKQEVRHFSLSCQVPS